MGKLVLKRPSENISVEIAQPPLVSKPETQPPSHHRFARVYDIVSDGIRIVDRNCNVLYVNAAFSRFAGIDSRASFGTKCYDAFPCPKCNTDRCTLKILQKGRPEIRCRVVKKGADGQEIHGTMISRPLWGKKNQLIGMITGFRDNTEIREARRALEEVQGLLESETRKLDQKRVALREVLHQIEDERKLVSMRIQANLDQAVLPLLHKLARKLGPSEQEELAEIEVRLEDVLSPFVSSLSRRTSALTPR